MAFTIPDDELGTVSKLSNYPNRIERLKAATLKGRFDADAKTVMGALKSLIQELGLATAARNVGFEKTTAVNADNVQDAIENVQSQIAGVSQGGIADGAVTAEKIADGAVGTDAIADAAVTYDKIKDKAVGSAKLADNAVSAKKIASDAVQERQIFDGAVTESKIGYYAVTANKIASKAVTGEKIADGAVTGAKLAPNAVTNEKVGDKALVEALTVTASTDAAESAATVQSCKFVYVKALGVVLFQVELRGLSSAEIADGVSLTLSGLTRLPSEMVSCVARMQYVTAQGYAEYTTAPALLVPDGYLTIRFPTGVEANANDSIMLSGWYFC